VLEKKIGKKDFLKKLQIVIPRIGHQDNHHVGQTPARRVSAHIGFPRILSSGWVLKA
jgi:methylmalonyl-CoA mutase cobalamin-binding subunit